MSNVQILKNEDGEPAFAVLRYDEYLRLRDAAEDAADLDAYREAMAAGGEATPIELTERIVAGENAVRVWREFRGLTQARLAARAGITQADVSRIERAVHGATVKTMRAIAEALGAGLDDLA